MSDAATHHLEPTLLIGGDRLALWRLQSGHDALAIFSSAEAARRYADAIPTGTVPPRSASPAPPSPATEAPTSDGRSVPWRATTPEPETLVALLVQCVRGGLTVAALDPDSRGARRLFDLREVLRGVREQVRRGEPPRFGPAPGGADENVRL